MRFMLRALLGATLSAALLGAGGWSLWRALDRPPPEPAAVAAEPRVVAPVATLERVTARPVIEAFGEIRSWRTLQLRAAVPGRIVALSPDFREGAAVRAGDLLFRIDPADYQARLADADLAVEEARADLAEAREAVTSARLELEASRTQAELRADALDRQTGLADRGFSASAAVDEARLAEAQARQAAASSAQALVTAELGVSRAELALRRAGLNRDEAARRLDETEARAPFDGVLAEVSAALGDMAAANDTLGALIDPAALEAELRLSNAEFARLLDDRGGLVDAPVTLTLALADRSLTLQGVLDRFGAGGAGVAGRSVYARLDTGAGTVLRPGDFVTAAIQEPPLADVAEIPAAALTGDGRLLLVDDDDRLREVRARVLRRGPAMAVVAGVPFGARFVTARNPRLGAGVLIEPAPQPAPVAAAGPGPG